MLVEPADQDAGSETLMIDASHLMARRTASSQRLIRGRWRLIGRTKSGLNSKLHAVTDALGRAIRVFPIGGYTSDQFDVRARRAIAGPLAL